MSDDQQTPTPSAPSQLKDLIAKGKEQGFLTYAEVNDHLPEEIVDPEQVEDIINMINDMGIPVHEVAPDTESLVLSDASATDDNAAEEAAAALASIESELGRTTDPVRMYMREMGSVELLTREGEIVIAKRIEEGLKQVIIALATNPRSVRQVLNTYEQLVLGEGRLTDLINGFHVEGEDEIAIPVPHQNATAAAETEDAADEAADDVDGDDEAETLVEEDTGPTMEEAKVYFDALHAAYDKVIAHRKRKIKKPPSRRAKKCPMRSWNSNSCPVLFWL